MGETSSRESTSSLELTLATADRHLCGECAENISENILLGRTRYHQQQIYQARIRKAQRVAGKLRKVKRTKTFQKGENMLFQSSQLTESATAVSLNGDEAEKNNKANEFAIPPTLLREELFLTLEEAFYLFYELGVLEIAVNTNLFEVLEEPSGNKNEKNENCVQKRPNFSTSSNSFDTSLHTRLQRSDAALVWKIFQRHGPRFVELYVAYRFFRHRGWIVRCAGSAGKLGTDSLLYRSSPDLVHAEFTCSVTRIEVGTAPQASGVTEENQNASSSLEWDEMKIQQLLRTTGSVSKKVLLVAVYINREQDDKEKDLCRDDGHTIPFSFLQGISFHVQTLSRVNP